MKATWQGWTTGLLGVWIFIAAFLNFTPTGNLWNDLIVGVIVAIAGYAMIKSKPWQGWLAGIAGVWLVIAAFIPALQAHDGNMWNDTIVGIIFMIAGFAALNQGQETAKV